MKPDGETMETKEPIEAAAVAEPSSSQEDIREQAPSQPEDAANDAAPRDAPNANGKPVAADSKIKPKAVVNKMQPTAKPTGVCGSHSRSGTASQRTGNDVKSSNNVSAAAGSKTTTAAKSSLAAGAIPKRPIGVAAVSSTIKNQTRMPDKKPVGQPRTTSVAPSTVTNGTKPTSVLNAAKKRPGVESVAARPKTTASTSRPTASTAPKPSTSTTAKAGAAAVLKTTRPATTPLTSRPASTSSRPTTATTKPPTSAAAKTSASRVTTASSTGWMSAAQLPKNVAAKKDISRPPSAAMTKKPATTTTSAATRKPEPSKPTATVKINSASKWSTTAKAADPKVSQSKPQPPAKSTPVKKPVTTVRFPAHNKPPLVQNSPASLADKSANCTTSQAKRGTRPTQAVSPFTSTKRAGASHTTTHAVEAQSAAGAAVAAATAVTVAAERQMEATLSLPHASSFAITPGVVPEETAQNFAAASSPLQNPVRTALPQTPPPQEHLESSAALLTTPQQTTVADEPRLPPVAAPTAVTIATERQMEATLSLPHASSFATSAPEEVLAPVLAQGTTLDIVPEETAQNPATASFPLQNPTRTALPQMPPPQEHLESSALLLTTQQQTAVADEPRLPPVASPPDLSEEPVYLLTDQTPSTSKVLPAAANDIPQIVSSTNLNEEDDEEEREGSQLISLSEMSGTTQPTEESRPGSGGPVGGSAWRAGGALLSELDSEEVSGSHQGASELSAPGVLEGTESMDDLGDGSLKGAIDMEGASAGSPDFEKVPDIPVNDFEEDEDEDDDDDRVCDMDVGSERADEPQRLRHDNDVDDDEEEDEDVEMASEGVTESGLESYGNADEDDFVEDERLDNLNRVAQPPPPPPPLLPSAPAAQWDQPNPFADPWAEHFHPQQVLEHVSLPIQVEGAAAASPLKDPWQADSETPTQTQAQAWLEVGSGLLASENKQVPHQSAVKDEPQNLEVQMHRDESGTVPVQTLVPAPLSAPGMSLSSTLSSETSTPEDLGDCYQHRKFQPRASQAAALSSQPDLDYQDLGVHTKRGNGEGEEEAMDENLPADEVLRGIANAPTSNPSSSSSATEDEASDTEGEAQLDDSLESPLVCHVTFDRQPTPQRCLSTVEEGEEAEMVELEGGAGEDTTPPSATSLASYGFDTMTTASNSNAQSTGESCIKSPGIFSLEELPEETKDPCVIPQPHIEPCLSEQQYIECGKLEYESVEQVSHEGPEEAPDSSSTPSTLQQPEEHPDDNQPPYYSAICEKTENSFAGFTALLHPHRRDHTAYPRTYCDIIKPHSATVTPPKLTCADLPPRNLGQQALSPQLRRLEQHQRQLLELQQRREQQSRPLEEAEQERKRREEEEQRKKKEEAEEEIKRNKEEEQRKMQEQAEVLKEEEEEKLRKEIKQREHLELQLQQQQQELMKWQPELQQCNQGQMVLLSPSSGLCTIYEALENSDEEEVADEEKVIRELVPTKTEPRPDMSNKVIDYCETVTSDEDKHQDSSPSAEALPPISDSSLTHSNPSQDRESSSPVSPEPPPPLDLDWGKKVDIVQHLINQTLLLNRDGCNSLLLLPGGAGGTLSPLESSLWPSMLPPLTPPSATVTSVSSFSPEATGSSPQGEWTVVELETHH